MQAHHATTVPAQYAARSSDTLAAAATAKLMSSNSVIVVLLLAILVSLGAAMVFLVRDPSDRKRTVRALTVRITLSLTLIAILLIGFYTGWIQPHGIGG